MDLQSQPFSIEDPAFIEQLRAGSDRAFEDLVRHEGGRMLAVARRLVRSDDDASDCVQEAFVQIVRNIATFEQRARLSTWLHRIVVNAALMKLRTRARHPETALDDLLPKFTRFGARISSEPGSSLPSVEQVTEQQETRQQVRAAIDQLPEIYRTVLLLRDIEEYDTDTVAQMLGINASAVKTRLHRARAGLKRILEQSTDLKET